MTKVMRLFHCTYPVSTHRCEVSKLAEAPYETERFSSKEKAFREFAQSHGVDLSRATYSTYTERRKGCVWDHSSLLAPTGNGEEYYRVAFYS